MKLKQLAYWILTAFICLCIMDATLRLYFHPTDSRYPLAIIHAFHIAKNNILYKITPEKPIGIWEGDPRFGYSHIANSIGTHETPEFKVTYTIGADKERYTPKPENPVGKILFLGGSFTFGHGVNDNEISPYILSAYWKHWTVVNKAVMGWGTSHAYMTLLDEIKSDDPPSVIIYGMIPHHIDRNYIRNSWVKTLSKYHRDHPHFEIVGNHLIFKGLVNASSNLVDPPDIDNRELELTSKFLGTMNELCLEHNIRFIVVILRQGKLPDAIYKSLSDDKIQTLDLSELKFSVDEHDKHPDRNGPKQIADAIYASFIVSAR